MNATALTPLSPAVSLEIRDGIALVWCDNPPVNAISQSIRAGLFAAMERLAADDSLRAAIVICRGRTFFAGADITEFGKPEAPPRWRATDRAIDNAQKPVIAAIHGTCFGGGFEFALACHYRIAVASAQFGFPEVKLGLVPGGGGTQRFPRIAGFDAALDAIPSGRNLSAAEALKLGAIDRIAEGDLADAALTFARGILTAGAPLPRARDREDKVIAARENPAIFDKARDATRKRFRGLQAPLRAIDAIQNALSMDFESGWEAEVAIFHDCVTTAEHRAMAHVFFAEREARRVPDLAKDATPREIVSVAVIGGGTMGRGIALAFADKGIPVRLIEVDATARDKALGLIRKEIETGVTRGRLTEAQATQRIASITGVTGLAEAAAADLVIEAVFEDMAVKKKVFAELDRVMPKGAILATNTSNLDVDAIAAMTSRPQDVIGLHFFSPANIMKLLEIVRGAKTAPGVLATALALAKRIGKQPVVSRVCDGFIANRAFGPYWREMRFLVEEGASPYDVDKALLDFGMPMGPFALSDLVGLDVNKLIRANERDSIPAGARIGTIEDELADLGRHGQKTGRGWYRYEPGARAGSPDPEVLDFVAAYRKSRGTESRPIGPEEIVERCLYGVINEGAKQLAEGIAIRSSDIDIAAIYGYGFPNYRGGPMHYADEIGIPKVAATIRKLHEQHGYWWQPAPLLLELAASGRRFADLGAKA